MRAQVPDPHGAASTCPGPHTSAFGDTPAASGSSCTRTLSTLVLPSPGTVTSSWALTASRIAQRGMAVREAVNAQLAVTVPGLGKTSVDNVLVHELPDAAGVTPNALVWGPGQVDAAPCGSGTCARMALFHHRGLMRAGSSITSRGLLGLDFTGRIAGETIVDGRRAILPEITGTSYLTGFSQFLFDPEDPVRAGFLLEA